MCTDEFLEAGQVSSAHFGLLLLYVRPCVEDFSTKSRQNSILRGFCVMAMSMSGEAQARERRMATEAGV